MTDDFLSNSNYYNKGGLNGKPKEPRPIPPKGQQSSNKCVSKDRLKLEQALDEIEKIANKQRKFDLTGKTSLIPVINEVGEDFIDILDIINKTKEIK